MPTKDDLLELLQEVADIDPTESSGEMCHYCLAARGDLHSEACLWQELKNVLGEGDESASARVGDNKGEFLGDPDMERLDSDTLHAYAEVNGLTGTPWSSE